jgi:hypothetical protein
MRFEKFANYFWLSAIRQHAEREGLTQQEAVNYLRHVPFPKDEELYRYYNTIEMDYDKAATDWLDYLETPADSHIPEARGY